MLSRIVNFILGLLRVYVIYRAGQGIGDQVCMSAIVRILYNSGESRIVVISSCPEIFWHNPKVWWNVGYRRLSPFWQRALLSVLSCADGKRINQFSFRSSESETLESFMRRTGAKMHLVEAYSRHFRDGLNYADVRSEIFLTENEKSHYKKLLKLPARYAVIHPSTKTGYTPNKEWGIIKFQQVVSLMPDICWVQTGLENDQLLSGVMDFRGKTKSLRELFYLISNALFVLAPEGLYNHVSSALDVTSFVIFSGFHPVEIAKYDNTVPIVRESRVSCAPCWLLTSCPHLAKPCTEDIMPVNVVSALRDFLASGPAKRAEKNKETRSSHTQVL